MHTKPKGVEDLARRVWGDKVTLALVVHAFGGIGLGILASNGVHENMKGLAYALMSFSMLAHIYAFLTMRLGEEASPAASGTKQSS